jgi:hypothetical protein
LHKGRAGVAALGADDDMNKPFSPRDCGALIARL